MLREPDRQDQVGMITRHLSWLFVMGLRSNIFVKQPCQQIIQIRNGPMTQIAMPQERMHTRSKSMSNTAYHRKSLDKTEPQQDVSMREMGDGREGQ